MSLGGEKMPNLYVARSAKLGRWASDVGLGKNIYKVGAAEGDPKALAAAGWAGDLGVVVHRHPAKDPTRTDIYIRKVRFKSVGKIGVASLRYDRATGRYAELTPPPSYGAAKGYRDD